jgi:two-component system chemotaxis sensor kinase CheA
MIEEHGIEASGIVAKWDAISAEWTAETSDIDKVLGLSQRANRISLTRSKFERLEQHAKAQQNKELQSLLVDCLRQPLQDVFARYDDYLRATAVKLEKQIQLVFAPDSSELAAFEVQKLDAAFNHILRNCVDHGIESPERRQELGKAPQGTIQWAMYRKANGMLHFVIRDDGQGVNGEKLAQKAVKAGYWTEAQAQVASQQDKVNLLFLPQLSSRDEVTELSGRGVGMDAVKELLQHLGGTISVRSESGAGTTFEMEIAPQSAGSEDQLRRSA